MDSAQSNRELSENGTLKPMAWGGYYQGFDSRCFVTYTDDVEYLLSDNNEWVELLEDGYQHNLKSFRPVLKYFYRDKATFYQHRDDDFMVKINPVFDFAIGKESASDQTLFTNTRGINVRGWIAKKVGYEFFLTENQARYPLYVRQRIDSFGAVPNEGYYKGFKVGGVDFFEAKGYFDFTAAKFITIQFGHGKNFLGNGIRSLALSDFSENYLFLKLQTQVWKFNYQNLFMDLTGDFLRGGDKLLPKKFAAIHHFSINATKWLNAGVFETVVFHRNDGFEFQYLNPVIFYRSVEQLLGSPDNSMLGIDYRLIFFHHLEYYGQVALDDYNFQASKGKTGYWGNKYGIQQGIKYDNAFTVSNLDLQLEWNYVRPYTYTHDDSIANYSNYNQPLANPLGANFSEVIGMIHYQPIFPLTIETQVLLAVQGRDTSNSNWGGNIFIPTTENNVESIYGNQVAQGVKNHLVNFQLSVSYMIKHNLFADVTYIYRKTTSDFSAFNSTSNIFQAGIRMNIDRKSFSF
ncbi:MAG TPA: hypothetical protein VE978_19330 [Chitinophagales bacterium]|nr:hypothetical protein [Chitinophagales bacterium]